ncbi:polysaccharide deacetylase family protein [Polaromonas sp. LjRoot131]|uniref:polysaccharide deacetylase family protein n=1 Tax=Polaromonas sp. LjRoot131 TaxID=3342262 RepID=UPI003ECFDA6F
MPTLNRQPIPILVYHQIAEAPPKGSSPFRGLYVSPAAFARQMAWLKRLGYTGLSMSGLLPYLRGELSGKVVGITFDDGYRNNLSHALPALVKQGFSSTCYAVSGLLGKTNIWDEGIGIPQTPLMDEGEIRQWMAGGQEIGSHTHSHVNLMETGEAGCVEEMVLGKTRLESVTGGPVAHFCYPYGHFEARHVEMAKTLGFATATTTQRSRCHEGMDLLQLPRVPVLRSTTLPVFWLKVATAYEDRRKK